MRSIFKLCPSHTSTLAVSGLKKCQKCRDSNTRRNKKLIAEGLCIYCSYRRAIKRKQYCYECRTKQTDRYHALRQEVLSNYCKGTPYCQCSGCFVVFIGFLQMDHKDGKGHKHKNSSGVKIKGPQLLLWLKKHGYPKGFQVLCANCNGGKRNSRRCPMYGKRH